VEGSGTEVKVLPPVKLPEVMDELGTVLFATVVKAPPDARNWKVEPLVSFAGNNQFEDLQSERAVPPVRLFACAALGRIRMAN